MINATTIYIDGQWVKPSSLEAVDVISPLDGEVVGRVPNGDAADVDRAVAAAVAAFPGWLRTSVNQRLDVLREFNALLRANQQELANLVHLEMGAPLDFAFGEHIGSSIAIIDNFIELVSEQTFEQPLGASLVVREPIGVVASILPWNYPVLQLVVKVVPAMAVGCTVVAKPSELTPLSTYRVVELAHEAGLPAGVLNLVPGTGAVVGEALCSHPGVDMVSFTGSTRAGRRVSEVAAQTVKRVALELGGKSASVVLPGADLETAVSRSVQAVTSNAGQACDCWSRLVVPRAVAAEVEELAIAAAVELDGTFGPAVSQAQFDRVQGYIELGTDEGARRIHGGTGNPDGGGQLQNRLTVFAGVTTDMRIAQEEVFGPVLSILTYDTVDEALEIANSTVYGLHGGVWGATEAEAVEFARGMRTGQVTVNGGDFDVAVPFGGYRQSGNGREQGQFGIDEFLEVKALALPSH